MTTIIRMPAFTATMETGKLVNWLVEDGAQVDKGQVIAEVETDKAIAEIESPVAGTVRRILVAAGDDDIDVETPLVELSADGDLGDSKPSVAAVTSAPTEAAPATGQPGKVIPGTEPPAERVPASPSARRLAKDAGIALEQITGSGPGGRITTADVTAHLDASSPAEETTRPKLSTMRSAIARSMVQSKVSVPHFYTETTVIIDDLVRLKKQLCSSNPGTRITVTTLLVHAVAKALDEVGEAKYRWENDGVEYKSDCDIGVAVALDSGLVVPVVRNVGNLGILEIASRLNQLVSDARAGKLKQSDLGDASLTISNLGMFSIDAFYPIVNMPEPLIIGVGRMRRTPVVLGDKVEIRSTVTITLALDHRVIDGAIAGRFADALQRHVESSGSSAF